MQNMLKGKNGVSSSKKLELEGALNEIEMFLSTLEYYKNVPKNVPEPDLETPIDDRSFLSKLFKK